MVLDLTDYSNNTNDLTNSGATEWTTDTVFAESTEAVRLVKTSNQYLYCSHDSSQNAPSAFTIEAGIKVDAWDQQFQNIISKGQNGSANYAMYVNNETDTVRCQFNSIAGGWTFYDSSFTVTQGVWAFVSCVWDGSKFLFYKNGIYSNEGVTGNVTTPKQSTDELTVGRDGANYISAKIDEIRVFKDVRTPTEIGDYYNKRLLDNENDLIIYYTFEEWSPSFTSYSGPFPLHRRIV
jgi:hypothetical protein